MGLIQRIRATAGALPDATEVDFVRWSTVPAQASGPPDDTIEDVLEHRHSGFTITGALDPDEAERASSTFRQHVDEWHEVGFGGMWGTPITDSWDGDRSAYLERNPRVCELYQKVFGFDIAERLTPVFTRFSGKYQVEVAGEGGRLYLPGSFREMTVGAGGLPAHTGNEFFEMGGDGPLNHLRATTRWMNSLSFFLMIDPPTKGGELRLYDLTWDERPDLRGFNNFDRDDRPLDEMQGAAVRAQAGDLVWFRGGDQWHKVAQIKGTRARVTFGGFMAPALDADVLRYWS